MVLDSVVQQRGAGHVGIGDPVVGQDPDGDAQQVVRVGFALPPVGRVQPARLRQRVPGPAAVSGGELLPGALLTCMPMSGRIDPGP